MIDLILAGESQVLDIAAIAASAPGEVSTARGLEETESESARACGGGPRGPAAGTAEGGPFIQILAVRP